MQKFIVPLKACWECGTGGGGGMEVKSENIMKQENKLISRLPLLFWLSHKLLWKFLSPPPPFLLPLSSQGFKTKSQLKVSAWCIEVCWGNGWWCWMERDELLDPFEPTAATACLLFFFFFGYKPLDQHFAMEVLFCKAGGRRSAKHHAFDTNINTHPHTHITTSLQRTFLLLQIFLYSKQIF